MAERLPVDVRTAKQRAGGESDVDHGDLIISERSNLGKLRISQRGRGVEHIRARAHADVELPLLALKSPTGKDCGLTRSEDALPRRIELIDCIEDFLLDRQSPLSASSESLHTIQDRAVDARLRCLVAERNRR